MEKEIILGKKRSLIVSLIFSVLVFAIFIGQGLWSDVVTFQKFGDDLKQCYPGMIKTANYLKNGFLGGVDTTTFNGATEFFSRSNMPNMYLPYIIAAFISQYVAEARLVYLALYFCQMCFMIYFSIRLLQRFFNVKSNIAILFSCAMITMALYEAWYLPHYLVVTLFCPVLYLELVFLQKKYNQVLLFAFPYVLCFTSGYITTAVVLAVVIWVITLVYGIYYNPYTSWKESCIKGTLSFALGAIISLPYCLQLLLYMKNVVKNASSSLRDTLYYKLDVRDLRSIVLSSFCKFNTIEQIELITIGLFWSFIVFCFFKYRLFEKKDKKTVLLKICLIINVLVVLIAMGTETPFVLWFYTFVPVFGSMHLPLRYLMITMPIMYLMLTVCMESIPDLKGEKRIKYTAMIFVGISFAIMIINTDFILKTFFVNRLIIELLLMAGVLYCIYMYGLKSVSSIALSCILILQPGFIHFYNSSSIDSTESMVKEQSLVFDDDKIDALDEYILMLCGEKERYNYAAFDTKTSVPEYILGNYAWFNVSKLNLANYMGYEIQLCSPQEYTKRFWRFDQMDWQYMLNTRADFLILDNEAIEKNRDILDIIVDWDNSNNYLNNTNRILVLKKYVPTYLAGNMYVEDQNDSWDNGYFYSPDFSSEAVTNFKTDDATYFAATVNAPKDSIVSFLLYPNANYHYYVNGEEITPTIDNMQVYISINEGYNNIEIIYKNVLVNVCNIIMKLFYLAILINLLVVAVMTYMEYRNRKNSLNK